MRRPRDLRHDPRDGAYCMADKSGCESRVAWMSPTPRQYRRVAAWLRKVADWYEHLASKQEQEGRR